MTLSDSTCYCILLNCWMYCIYIIIIIISWQWIRYIRSWCSRRAGQSDFQFYKQCHIRGYHRWWICIKCTWHKWIWTSGKELQIDRCGRSQSNNESTMYTSCIWSISLFLLKTQNTGHVVLCQFWLASPSLYMYSYFILFWPLIKILPIIPALFTIFFISQCNGFNNEPSTTKSLNFCKKHNLRHYNNLLKVVSNIIIVTSIVMLIYIVQIGWRKFRDRLDYTPWYLALLNCVYPIFIFLMLIFACFSQLIACFGRDTVS